MCQAPKYVAEEFLRGEGFAEVQYVKKPQPLDNTKGVAAGEADFSMQFSGPLIAQGTDWRFLNELKKELQG